MHTFLCVLPRHGHFQTAPEYLSLADQEHNPNFISISQALVSLSLLPCRNLQLCRNLQEALNIHSFSFLSSFLSFTSTFLLISSTLFHYDKSPSIIGPMWLHAFHFCALKSNHLIDCSCF